MFDERLSRLVVGAGGAVIVPIQSKTNTRIYVTKWKQNKEDKAGAIIYGHRVCVDQAKLELENVIKRAKATISESSAK